MTWRRSRYSGLVNQKSLFLYIMSTRKLHPLYKVKDFVEWNAWGVCNAIGERLGIATSYIRLWFIYVTFLTLGSPIVIYMILAFWRNLRHYVLKRKRNPVWW